MTTYIKNYIGKGKAVQINGQNTDLVQVTIKMEDAEAFIYEKEGHKYLTFQIAKLKEEDNFQRTHTCYISAKTEVETPPMEVNEPAPKKVRKIKKA